MNVNRRSFLGMAGSALLLPKLAISAEAFPSKPIRFVVPSAPGGATDLIGRVTASGLGAMWPQAVVVENKPGAGTSLGARYVASAEPDGYTLLLNGIASHAINPAVYKDVGYDPVKDFTPITLVATVANVLVVRPDFPASNLREFIELTKQQKKRWMYATPGNGTSPHLSAELLVQMTGVPLDHVPYGASARALNDLMGGQVDMVFDNISGAIPFVTSGRLKALGVTTPKRAASLPDVPTFDECGVSGYDLTSWAGLVGPAGMSSGLVQKIHSDSVAVLNDPKLAEKYLSVGATAAPMGAEEFGSFIAAQREKFRQIAKKANLKLS